MQEVVCNENITIEKTKEPLDKIKRFSKQLRVILNEARHLLAIFNVNINQTCCKMINNATYELDCNENIIAEKTEELSEKAKRFPKHLWVILNDKRHLSAIS